jgi:hypothetical protein
MHAALLSYMGKRGVPRRRVGGRLDGPCRDLAIMAYHVPEQWQLRGVGAQWTAVMSPGGFEGVADVDPYGIQWWAWRRPVPTRSTAPELLPQCPTWGCTRWGSHHAVNSGRDGVPPA